MPLAKEALEALVLPTAREIGGGRRPKLVTLPGGASLRRYHRVTVPEGKPASIVVMELGDERGGAEEASKGGAPKELPFLNVQRYLEKGGLAVPKIYRYDEQNGLLYMEDLGDITFESRVATANEDTRRYYYQLAIDTLVALQNYASQRVDAASCIAFSRGFDKDLLRWELDHFREWGLEQGAGARIPGGELRALEEMFDDIATRLAAEPRVFVHRDYQSRNLMVQETEAGTRLRVIDFQDALLGTRAYDLVALLRDSYVELAPALLDSLVDFFTERANLDEAKFRALFDLQTLQRKLKDAGRFVFIDRVKKNPGFLPYIPASQRYAAEALARLPEYARLGEIIRRYIPTFGA